MVLDGGRLVVNTSKFLNPYPTLVLYTLGHKNINNNSFIFIVDKPQLHNKLPRRTAQIQLNTKNQL